jgi:hypothetical protein
MTENLDYRVVSDQYGEESLEEKVNFWIRRGWIPLGGVSVVVERGMINKIVKFQAMVRER